jgi:hypothetical protein
VIHGKKLLLRGSAFKRASAAGITFRQLAHA